MRVSLPLTAERGRIHAVLAALCVLAAMVVAAAALPSAAHAEFTLKRCEGGAVKGEGSSFQAAAQALFQIDYNEPFGCEGSIGKVTYDSDGSGCGIASIGGGGSTGKCSDFESDEAKAGYRAADTRFAGSDAPLTPEQMVEADAAGSSQPGLIHILPIAIGATAVIVHFPEGCKLEDPGPGPVSANEDTTTGGPNDPGGDGSTGDTYAAGTLRVHIPAGILEEIWSGQEKTWGEVVNDHMMGAPTNPLEAEEGFTHCDEIPVRRIVRFDGSGTTYNFKAYLSLLPVGVGGTVDNEVWGKSPVVGTNTTWPLTTSSTGVPKAVPKTENAGNKEFVNVCNLAVSGSDRICTGSANGNPFVAAGVAATDGSIGYSDLATARQNGFTITPEAENGSKPDDTYWTPLQTINPEKPVKERVGTYNYVEPTSSPTSNLGNKKEIRGSNCTNADFRGIPPITASEPDPTLGDWANAIGTGSKDTTTYPNCAITYDFVWDDDSTVYGNSLEEQEKARSIKDYFTTIESEGAQLSLKGEDYGALPPEIIKIARIGVEAIGWEKSASSGKKEEVKPPPVTSNTNTGPSVVTPVVPSNAFSIASAKVKGKSIVLSLVLPDAGIVQVKATGGGVTVASASASASGGKGTVTLAISKAALSKLAKAKGHKLSVKITVTFTPTGGTAASQIKTLTVTQAAVTPKKKASKKGKKK
jgi:ABC-type phosphate transport system substrate-binding protein